MELGELLDGLLGELDKIARSDSVVGKSVAVGSANVVPLCRVSVGFGTGASDLSGSGGKRDGNFEAGGAAGGLTVEPRAFVVVPSSGVPHLLALHRGAATLQHPVAVPNAAEPAPPELPKRGERK